VLPASSADGFVADAFTRWTSIPAAAVSVTQAGHLAEDVNGTNVTVTNGVVTMPADILPNAVGTPVGIVYDAHGDVTNALLGQGAGDPGSCFSDAAFGGVDNFSADAHLVHALVVLNGNCAQTSDQLPDVKYRLVRLLGRVLGLDWSQANINVFTRNPSPTSDESEPKRSNLCPGRAPDIQVSACGERCSMRLAPCRQSVKFCIAWVRVRPVQHSRQLLNLHRI
jgi:hypothetical protein